MNDEWLAQLQTDLSRRVHDKSSDRIIFVGVGNRMRGDDGIGPVLIDMLKGHVAHAIDAGFTPENYTSAIKRLKPEVIVFIDAVKFDDLPHGYARMLDIEDVEKRRISVHNLSLDVVMGYLKEETGADVFMIGVQPSFISDREGLSPELSEAADSIAREVLGSLNARLS